MKKKFFLFINKHIKLIKIIITTILIAIIIHKIDFNELVNTFKNCSLFYIIQLFIISFILIFISTLKWGMLIRALGEKTKFTTLYSIYLISYFTILFLPAIGGDAIRSYSVGKKIGQHEAFSATFIEKFASFFSMLVLCFIFSFFADYITLQMKIFISLLFITSIVFIVCALSPRLLNLISKLPYTSRIMPHLHKIQSSFLEFKNDKMIIFKTFLLSFLFYTLTVVNVVISGYAVGWNEPSILGLFIVLPLIFLIGAVPLSPQGLGVQEGAYIYFMTQIGASNEQALGIAIILRIKIYILGLIGGIFYCFNKNIKSEISNFKKK